MKENNSKGFNLMHLDKYAIIKEPCTLLVKNNSSLTIDNLYKEDGHNRWIINLRAITDKNLNLIKELNKINKNLTYWDIGHLLSTGVIWEDQVLNELDLPVRGESIIATFDYVDKKLLCTNINLIPKLNPELYAPAIDILKELNNLENIINKIK